MIAELEIKKHLAQFLTGNLSLDEFEDWLVARSWNMHEDSMQGAQKLVGAIELILAEYSGAHISLDVLRKNLAEHATDVNVVLPCPESTIAVIAGSCSVTVAPEARWVPVVPAWGYRADTERETEYA